MKYLKEFNTHASYETEINGGVIDISLPNVSYCEDVKDVHYTPYNLVRFYVGGITGTTPQTVKIYTDSNTSVDVQVSENNKWYSYVLPKNKGLYKIVGDSVKKVVVKADINLNDGTVIIPRSTIEVSFKGSNTSKATDMSYMFNSCSVLKSLDLSNFDTSNVTDMSSMFTSCINLTLLDVSNFDTNNVTNMSYMFYGCRNLTSLDLRNFNTSKVTIMTSMFSGCSGLKSLDLSNFNTSKVTYMSEMFKGCTSLNTITMKNCSSDTIGKIRQQLTNDGIIDNITSFIIN